MLEEHFHIFKINKDENDMVDMNELCDIFTLKAINMNDRKNEGKTYFEVLFI